MRQALKIVFLTVALLWSLPGFAAVIDFNDLSTGTPLKSYQQNGYSMLADSGFGPPYLPPAAGTWVTSLGQLDTAISANFGSGSQNPMAWVITKDDGGSFALSSFQLFGGPSLVWLAFGSSGFGFNGDILYSKGASGNWLWNTIDPGVGDVSVQSVVLVFGPLDRNPGYLSSVRLDNIVVTSIPEMSTWVMLTFGLCILGYRLHRTQMAAAQKRGTSFVH